MLFSMLFLACGGSSELATHPDLESMQNFVDEFNYKEHQLDVHDLKEKFSVGAIKTVKAWGYDEEIEVSYVPLLKGEKEVAVLLTENASDIDDREAFKERAQNKYDSIFTVYASAPSTSSELVSSLVDGELVGINLMDCIDASMDSLWEMHLQDLNDECDEFQSPNKQWLELLKKQVIESAESDIRQLNTQLKSIKKRQTQTANDLASVEKELSEVEYGTWSLKRRLEELGYMVSELNSEYESVSTEKSRAEAKKKYYEALTIEQYIEQQRISSPNSSCVTAVLNENSNMRYNFFDSAAGMCTDYISRAKSYTSK